MLKLASRARTIAVTAAIVVATTCSVAAPGLAAPGHGRFGFFVLDVDRSDFCGDMAVHIHAEFRIKFSETTKGKSQLVYFAEIDHGFHAYTNLITGKTLTATLNGVQKDLRITDNGDGTITVVQKFSGVETLIGPDGSKLARHPGTFAVRLIVDHGGTPADPDDDVLLNEEVVKDNSSGADACVIFRAATA